MPSPTARRPLALVALLILLPPALAACAADRPLPVEPALSRTAPHDSAIAAAALRPRADAAGAAAEPVSLGLAKGNVLIVVNKGDQDPG